MYCPKRFVAIDMSCSGLSPDRTVSDAVCREMDSCLGRRGADGLGSTDGYAATLRTLGNER